MIRMNKHMHARFWVYTQALLAEVDPDDQLGLRALLEAHQAIDGGGPWRAHDFPALLERLRRNGGSSYSPPTNGVTQAELEAILTGATP